MRLAYDKANSVYARMHGRATTLEGPLSGTEETAILQGTGGSLLAQPFAAVVDIEREAAAVIGGLSQTYQMTGATLRLPTAGAATANKRAEGQTTGQGEPPYASVMMRAENLTCFMKASREFIMDSPFNAVSIFSFKAGRAIGAAEDVDMCTTDGVSPNASGPIVGQDVAEATPTVLTYNDLSKLYRSVPKMVLSA